MQFLTIGIGLPVNLPEVSGVEPFAAMESWLTAEQLSGFFVGNVIKYVARYNAKAPGKGGLPDLLKARDYLNRLINLEGEE